MRKQVIQNVKIQEKENEEKMNLSKKKMSQ